ncbi:alpha/beta fold hydrolase [Nocardia harenae]|uniref:alpha/beta fold hydrolase n=1 Tax=Nocardia harenae TaxID=358707 RepID=UPI00082A9246|nr:alpha/beta fold hydrolase [Nocardia harenae]
MTSAQRAAGLAALLVAGLLGAATATPALLAPAAAAPAVAFGDCPEGAVPAGLGVQCAVVEVPMNHADPDGARIELTVSRVPAQGGKRGVIAANPGGPGADALDYWARRIDSFPAAMKQYDRIAVQPRGMRWSTPLDCAVEPTGAEPAPPPGVKDIALRPRDELRATCEAALPGYLDTITTESTARDLDAVRAALGVDKLDYLGTSYGTYLGAVYATLFPEHTGRMVLDSNVNPGWIWTEEFAQQQVAGKQRLDDLFAWIAEHDAEYGLGGTPLQVYRNWVRLVADQGGGWYANLTPPPASVTDLPGALPEPLAEVARDGFNGSVEQIGKVQNLTRTLVAGGTSAQVPLLGATTVATYTRAFWPHFARAMADANADPRNTGKLLALEGTSSSDPTGQVVFTAITCNENAIEPRPELIAAAAVTIASGGSAMEARANLVRAGMNCGSWRPVAKPIAVDGAALETPPLLLQSRHDALTAYEGGPALARAVHGTLITVEGGDHGTFGRGNGVVDDAVVRYLETGEVGIDRADQAPLP